MCLKVNARHCEQTSHSGTSTRFSEPTRKMGIILMQSIEVVTDICAEYLSEAEVLKK